MRTCGGLLNTGNFHSEAEQNYLALGGSLILVHWENKAVLLSRTNISTPRAKSICGWKMLLPFSGVTWDMKARMGHLGCSRKYMEIFTQDLLKNCFDSFFCCLAYLTSLDCPTASTLEYVLKCKQIFKASSFEPRESPEL